MIKGSILSVFGLLFSAIPAFAEPALYSVPVSQALAPYATFNVNTLVKTNLNGKLYLNYDLPGGLVGEKQLIIEMNETTRDAAGRIFLESAQVRATCDQQKAERWLCMMIYKQPIIDDVRARSASVQSFLALHTSSAAELAQKTAVASEFSTEPAGILTVIIKAGSLGASEE